MFSMGRCTEEFKTEAYALALKSHRSHQEIDLDLGINPSTIRHWMSEAMMTDTPKNSKGTKKTQAELERELLAMKKRVGVPSEEIDILKKAAAYFAKNQKWSMPLSNSIASTTTSVSNVLQHCYRFLWVVITIGVNTPFHSWTSQYCFGWDYIDAF